MICDGGLFVVFKILRSLDANHLSLTRCAKEYGWHVTLLRLITVPFGSRPYVPSEVPEQSDNVSEEKKRGEENLIDTVLEIVFRVMWKGVEGFGENDWKVSTEKVCILFFLMVSVCITSVRGV